MGDQTMSRRRRRGSSPLDDDDLLGEILIRVPPQPSSLPRASLVCKRWRRLVTEPWFLRLLRAHHRTTAPPLLGFFEHHLTISVGPYFRCHSEFVFHPILEPPDRIPPHRLSLGQGPAGAARMTELLSCRHGRVIFLDDRSGGGVRVVFVCDIVTGWQDRLDVPREFTNLSNLFINGTVLCGAAGGEHGHVHGACHWSPFKVVMVSMSENDRRPMACVYSSETGRWGNIICHDHPCRIIQFTGPSTLVGHALCWEFSFGIEDDDDDDEDDEDEDRYMPEPNGVLEFNLETQRLAVLKGPPINQFFRCRAIKAMNGGVGLAILPSRTLQLQVWHRNVNCHDDGATTWVLFKTVDLYDMFGIQEHERWPRPRKRDGIQGYDEDDNVIFIYVDSRLFLLQLDSMQFKRHYERIERKYLSICHPFRSFLHRR